MSDVVLTTGLVTGPVYEVNTDSERWSGTIVQLAPPVARGTIASACSNPLIESGLSRWVRRLLPESRRLREAILLHSTPSKSIDRWNMTRDTIPRQ